MKTMFVLILALLLLNIFIFFMEGCDFDDKYQDPRKSAEAFLTEKGIDTTQFRFRRDDRHMMQHHGERYNIAYCSAMPDHIAFAVHEMSGKLSIVQSYTFGKRIVDPDEWYQEQGQYMLSDPKHVIADGAIYVMDGPRFEDYNEQRYLICHIKNISGYPIKKGRIDVDILDSREVQLKHERLRIDRLNPGQEAFIKESVIPDIPLAGHEMDHLGNIKGSVNFDI